MLSLITTVSGEPVDERSSLEIDTSIHHATTDQAVRSMITGAICSAPAITASELVPLVEVDIPLPLLIAIIAELPIAALIWCITIH